MPNSTRRCTFQGRIFEEEDDLGNFHLPREYENRNGLALSDFACRYDRGGAANEHSQNSLQMPQTMQEEDSQAQLTC